MHDLAVFPGFLHPPWVRVECFHLFVNRFFHPFVLIDHLAEEECVDEQGSRAVSIFSIAPFAFVVMVLGFALGNGLPASSLTCLPGCPPARLPAWGVIIAQDSAFCLHHDDPPHHQVCRRRRRRRRSHDTETLHVQAKVELGRHPRRCRRRRRRCLKHPEAR